MIYLDNAATTLYKPQEVDAAILDALHTAGNPGRGAHEPTLHASRLVYAAREALAELFHAPDPACIAFTANATGALNTALCGLLGRGIMSSLPCVSTIRSCGRCTGCGHRGPAQLCRGRRQRPPAI